LAPEKDHSSASDAEALHRFLHHSFLSQAVYHILISLIKSYVIAKMKNRAVNRTQQSQM